MRRVHAAGRSVVDQLVSAVRHVDDDAQLVAAADHLDAELCEAAMHAGLGLDVAQLVGPIVRKLQMPQRPAPVGLVESLDPALEEIAAFRRNNDRRPAGARPVEIRRGPEQRQLLCTCQRMDLLERRWV